MIVQKDFLSKLRDFGLNTYESKIWTALLSRGVSTAGELSDIANVPRSRSYDVLESLEKKGFVIMKLGKPIKYIAVPPEETIERVKKRIQEDAQRQSEMLEELKTSEALSELNLLHAQGVEHVDPVDLSGSLKGRDNLYNHLASMIKTAEKSVAIATTEQGLIRKYEALRHPLEKAVARGVKIRIIAPITKNSRKAATELSKVAEIRNHANKSRFCIVDGKELAFMLLDDKKVHPSYDIGVWVSTQLFANTLHNLFEHMWSEASMLETVSSAK